MKLNIFNLQLCAAKCSFSTVRQFFQTNRVIGPLLDEDVHY